MPRKKTANKKLPALPAAGSLSEQRSHSQSHIDNGVARSQVEEQEYIQQVAIKCTEYSTIKKTLGSTLMEKEPDEALQHVIDLQKHLTKELYSYRKWKKNAQKRSGIRVRIYDYEEILTDLWEQIYTLRGFCIMRATDDNFQEAQLEFNTCIDEGWKKSLDFGFESVQTRVGKTSAEEIKSLCLVRLINHYIKEKNFIKVVHLLTNMTPEFRKKYGADFQFTAIIDSIFPLLYSSHILSPDKRAYKEFTLFSFNRLNYDKIVDLQKKVKALLGNSDNEIKNVLVRYAKETMVITLRMGDKFARFFNAGSFFLLMLNLEPETAHKFFPTLQFYCQEAISSLRSEDNTSLNEIEGKMGAICDQYQLSLADNSDQKKELEKLRDDYLKSAASRGYLQAAEVLAQVTNDRPLQKALAEKGFANSCYNEAVDLIDELPPEEERTQESYSKILSLLHKAVDQNFSNALLELGKLFLTHPLIADNAKAIEYLEHAAEYNMPTHWIFLAVALHQSKDPVKMERAFELLHMAKNAGNEEEIVRATAVLAEIGFIQAHSDLMHLVLCYDNRTALDQLKSIKSALFDGEVFNTLGKIQNESSEKSLYKILTSIQTSFTYYIEAISLSPDKIALLKSDLSSVNDKFVYFFQEMTCVFSVILKTALFQNKNKEQIKIYINIAYNHLMLLLQQYPQEKNYRATLEIIYRNFVEFLNKNTPFTKLTEEEIEAKNATPRIIDIPNRVKPSYELSEASVTTVLQFCQKTNTDNVYYLAHVFYQLGIWAKRNSFESEFFLLRNKEEIASLMKRFQDGLQFSAKIEGLENALIGLGLLRIRPRDPVLNEMVSQIIRKIDESTEALSVEQCVLFIQGFSYFDMTKNQNVLSRLIDKIIEHPKFNSISFRQIAILCHSLAIIEANLIKKNGCNVEIVKKFDVLLAHLLQPTFKALENRQPYFSLHQFILAMDYFKYSRGDLIMPLIQNKHYALKFKFIKKEVEFGQTVSALQQKVQGELEQVYGKVISEQLFGLLPGDCFLSEKHILIEVNGKTHYYHTALNLASAENPSENIELERTHLDIFHCHYKVLAYWAENEKLLQIIIVPYTMENKKGLELKEYIEKHSVANSITATDDERFSALNISASAARSVGFLPMPRPRELNLGAVDTALTKTQQP